jgi:hypothetical protein
MISGVTRCDEDKGSTKSEESKKKPTQKRSVGRPRSMSTKKKPNINTRSKVKIEKEEEKEEKEK